MNGRLEKEIRATKNMTVRIEDSGSEDEKKNDYRLITEPKMQNSQLLKILILRSWEDRIKRFLRFLSLF